jgi:protein-S-isoprenylcysteine O-methyltransferase Ste14
MISFFSLIAYAIWAIMFVVWMAGRFGNRRTLRRPSFSKYLVTGLLYACYAILFIPPFLEKTIWRNNPYDVNLSLLGIILCVLGASLAIWARIVLGRNWSAVVGEQREEQKLVTNGPYRFARHPIYAGFLLAVLGFALTIGTVLSFSAALLGLVALLLRIPFEEKQMNELFPNSYKEYSNRVKKLIPYIW